MDVARDEDAEDRLMEADDWFWQNLEEQEEEKRQRRHQCADSLLYK